jgi:hypothetical protein
MEVKPHLVSDMELTIFYVLVMSRFILLLVSLKFLLYLQMCMLNPFQKSFFLLSLYLSTSSFCFPYTMLNGEGRKSLKQASKGGFLVE